ncbi:hypothetical protein GW17_00021400 [Ensete ventricosum]|nr:hypothetical protein GW17_00021400 [Ensete ventricosum]
MELVSFIMFQLQSVHWKRYVVKAAQARVPVFRDGGVRRGTDVFKALALGASSVFMLRDEFELTMALSGCTSPREITGSHIVTEADSHLPAARL